MGAAAYVGRVGGLAAALGIGAAVLYGCGAASADTGAPSGSASSSASAGSDSKSGSATAGKPRAATTVAKAGARAPGAYSTRTAAVPATSTAGTTVDSAPATGHLVDRAAAPIVSLTIPSTDGAPTTPPLDVAATWSTLAAARKHTESGARPPTSIAANSGPVSAALTTEAANVVVTPAALPGVAVTQTPPLAFLQRIPVLGPVLVTPIVAFIHQIPIFGDLVHPFVGYPVDPSAPANAPVARDIKLTSFDGTQIYVHFMPATGLQAGQQAPTILAGPGLGMPGSTSLDGTPFDGILTGFLGAVQVGTLRNAGYNVVTWDPRGEYNSGGELELDSPDFEARDVSAIVSWMATQPEVQLDAPGDPRFGMVGASYGGGVQWVTAATDHRVDAIVPAISWNTLNSSLYPNQAFKTGWGSLLTAVLVATLARPNPAIYPAAIYGLLTGSLTPEQRDLLTARGPAALVGDVTAPTLIIQGTVDTLFTLQEANLNALTLINAGVPTKVVWFCGGHGLCTNNLFDPTDGNLITEDTLAWLARYVKQDQSAVTGPQFEWVDQSGQYYSSSSYPASAGTPISASSNSIGTMPLLPFIGGSGPLLLVAPIGGTRALNAYNLTVPAPTSTTYIVGAPQLSLTYSGQGISSHVYAQLVDDTTGQVLGNQIMPIPVTLDGQPHTVNITLQPVAETLQPGHTVTLQLVASSADYQTLWTAGALTVSHIQITLPTVDDAAVVASVMPR